jgi:ribose transport system substrate-binding protein
MKRISIAVLLAVLITPACGRGQDDDRLTIAVIPKGTTHAFWQSIRAGAERAGREHDVNVIWRGPLREDDRASQITEVEGFITRGVSGIVLAPLDETALALPVADAQRRNIPVVIFDSGLKGADYVSFVATDNHKGGRLAGEHIASRLNGREGSCCCVMPRGTTAPRSASRAFSRRSPSTRVSRSSARTSMPAPTWKARTSDPSRS